MEEFESFVFYRSFYDATKDLDNDTLANVMRAICEKGLNNKDIELDGIAKALYTLIRPQLEANTKRKLDGHKGAEYGKLGGRPKKEKEEKTPVGLSEKTPRGLSTKTPNANANVNAKVNVNANDTNDANASDSDTQKASKKKYGEYKNVLLKDEEFEALKKEYPLGKSEPSYEELIAFLDEYIEMKGYKAKSHYLCIIRWVIQAVKEKKQRETKSKPKNQNFSGRKYSDDYFSSLYANNVFKED